MNYIDFRRVYDVANLTTMAGAHITVRRPWTKTECAEGLLSKFGRSPKFIRLLLVRHDRYQKYEKMQQQQTKDNYIKTLV